MTSVLQYVLEQCGHFDRALYARVLGAANAFKEGDAAIDVAAPDDAARQRARAMLAATTVAEIHEHPLFEDGVERLVRETTDVAAYAHVHALTLGELKQRVLTAPEDEIKTLAPGLHSDVIACVVRLMSDDELRSAGARIFHPLPGSCIGARGYLGARVQPNSPTDDPEDIVWQVFNAWSFAVGDVLLGTNPVDSRPESVAAVQAALRDVLESFELDHVLPHCVLAHIDVQAEVEALHPGSTALWFQSLAGTDAANETFGISVDGMRTYARSRKGPFGLYLETGQGADFTNGHGNGFDMVAHEARKYGFARALAGDIRAARNGADPWLHLNDVAGFIGPEVFRTREQLVRCCLEDIVMGKLHGLTIGLDVCSTLHMDVTLDDLDWCLDRIVPAAPAYLMALPTRNDPMLSYLTTSFQDHVRLREQFGTRVDDRMWAFFQRLGVIDDQGRPTQHFGDPNWVHYRYCRARGDERPADAILTAGEQAMAAVQARGVPLAVGHGEQPWTLQPALDTELRRLYADAKQSLWAELSPEWIAELSAALPIASGSADREDYVTHPVTGEQLGAAGHATLEQLRAAWGDDVPDVQLVVSDGLNARAITDDGHVLPFLDLLRRALEEDGHRVCPDVIVITGGRVRAGYRCGEILFGRPDDDDARSIVHVIGERPGSGHHNFSAYVTSATAHAWNRADSVDHDITRVVSGISDTALEPQLAAAQVVQLHARLRADADADVH